jgi:hypothetical protein
VKEHCLLALADFAGYQPSFTGMALSRDQALQIPGCLQAVQAMCEAGNSMSVIRRAASVLAIFCGSACRTAPDFELVHPILTTIKDHMLQSTDNEVLVSMCTALTYLSYGPNDIIQAAIDTGVCSRLFDLLMHPHPSINVQTYALRALGSMVGENGQQTQVVIDAGIILVLLEHLSEQHPFGNRWEAATMICQACQSRRTRMYCVSQGCIPLLCDLLGQPGAASETMCVVKKKIQKTIDDTIRDTTYLLCLGDYAYATKMFMSWCWPSHGGHACRTGWILLLLLTY